MSKNRPAASGYARLAQADEEQHGLYNDSEDDDDVNNAAPLSKVNSRYAAIHVAINRVGGVRADAT